MRNAPQADVGGAKRAVPSAALARIARIAASGATNRGRGLEAVDRAVVVDSVAELVHVAGAICGTAEGRALGVCRTRRARPGAAFEWIANSAGGTAGRGAGLEAVGRAGGARTGAAFCPATPGTGFLRA